MKKLAMTGIALLLLTFTLAARDGDAAKKDQPDTLGAEFHDDHIDLDDGRELQVVKNRLPHVGSQVVMMAPAGASVTIQYEDGKAPFVGKVPFVYKVPLERNNEHFRLVVTEGIPPQTWRLDMVHDSGYSLEISSDE